MAGLENTSVSTPAGSSSLAQGDDALRSFKQDVINFANNEHHLDGAHKCLRGPISTMPSAGKSGRFYILEVDGVETELYYDNGVEWKALTTNQEIADNINYLPTHKAALILDHPNASVTTEKIANNAVTADKLIAGALLKRHFNGSADTAPVGDLVNGGNADSLHVHAPTSATVSLFTSGVLSFTFTELGNGIAISGTQDVALGIGCDTLKRYIVVARPVLWTGSHIGTDDYVRAYAEARGEIVSKVAEYIFPQVGNGDFSRNAEYYARFSVAGMYWMTYGGGAGPHYVEVKVHYEVYEVNQ